MFEMLMGLTVNGESLATYLKAGTTKQEAKAESAKEVYKQIRGL